MALDPVDEEHLRVSQIQRFAGLLALVAALLAALPCLVGWMSAPTGSLYFGIQTNLDDHMVYAAWMRQAMDGRFFLDNRFAVDAQPGLTVHLYFWALGLLANVLTIPVAMAVARLGLTYLFVRVFGKFLVTLKVGVFAAKYMLLMACFGGGLGFVVWEKFGQEIVNRPPALTQVFGPHAPIDVWQPEAFVFPSMLTNGLFMVSLCLILTLFRCLLTCRDSWSPVLPGAVAAALLMNIHSYDVLLVALVMVAFGATQIAQRTFTVAWLGRASVIAAGAVPPALWFLKVLSEDPVFQARAATPTFSPDVRQVLFGIFPAFCLAIVAIVKGEKRSKFAPLALAVLVALLLVLSESYRQDAFMMGPAVWGVVFAGVLGTVALASSKDTAWNFAWSWALAGVVGLYFPALFQRKLAMGLMVPWAMLAAFGLLAVLKSRERSTRNLVATLTLFLFGASSLLWFQREIVFIRTDVGRTAVHSVFFSQDVRRIIDTLGQAPGRKVVIAMPGVWNPTGPADFGTPQVVDLNAVLSGIAGVYTYAGHWSETPDYNRRRSQSLALFLAGTRPEVRSAILDAVRPDYVVAPNPQAFPTVTLGGETVSLADLRPLGEAVYSGNQFLLIKVRRP